MSNDFLDCIAARAATEPGRPFGYLHLDGTYTAISVGELFARARRFAGLIAAANIRPREVVFVVLRHGLDAYAAFLGAMLAGAVPSYLPYPNSKHDHSLYWSQHRKLFARVRPAAVLVYDELLDAMRACADGSGTAVLAQSNADKAVAVNRVALTTSGDIALLQHSSGTTGLKKGVALSYGAIARQIEAYAPTVAAGEGSVIGSWLPLYHDMGLIAAFLMPLYLGIPIVSLDPFVWVADPKLLLQAVEQYRATHLWLPNFAFLHFVRAVPRTLDPDLSSLRAIINCSEPCKPAALDAFLTRFQRCGVAAEVLQTCYAMAETVFAVSQNRVGAPPRRLSVSRTSLQQIGRAIEAGDDVTLLSNGPPISGCQVAVRTGGGMAGEHVLGELCVRGDFLFDGYHKNPEATAEAFVDGWYRTGDIGFIDRGEIYIAGRVKEVIIVNGKNIFAHDVEACLAGTSGMKAGRAVAIGKYDEAVGSEQLVVIAEHDDSGRPPSAIMSDINRAVLEETGIPCSVVEVVAPGWLIKTTSGKISRADNLRKYLREFGGQALDV